MAWMIPAAIAGSAIFGASSAQGAANTQAASAREAAALQKQMYDEQVARNQPYTQAGLAAQERLMRLMGLRMPATSGVNGAPSVRSDAELRNALIGKYTGPTSTQIFSRRGGDETRTVGGQIDEAGLAAAIAAARQGDQNALGNYQLQQEQAAQASSDPDFGKYARDFSMADFQQDPGYAFRLSEGQKALDRQAAARGGLMSGAALKAAARYGQDMGSQEYGNAFNRYQVNRTNQLNPLGNLMASGQLAANNQGTAAANYGTNAGNLMMQGGQAIAAGQLGQGNTFNNALNTMASSYQNQNNFNNWMNQNRQPSYGYVPSNANTLIPMQAGGGY